MKFVNLEELYPNHSFLEEVHPNVWLMDDHRWAYYVWEKFVHENLSKKPYALVHLDFHWDGVNDFLSANDQDMLRQFHDLDDIFRLVSEEIRVRKDSFIAPAIIRGLIKEVHFLCYQRDTTPGIDQDLLDRYNSKQFFHNDLISLLEHAPRESVFDVDLDLFNRSDNWAEGDLWTGVEIFQFLDTCIPLLQSSPLVTIAMSFNYSGDEDDTRHLTKLIVPTIVDIFQRKSLTTP